MILDENGSPQTSSLDVLRVFAKHFKSKWPVHEASNELQPADGS